MPLRIVEKTLKGPLINSIRYATESYKVESKVKQIEKLLIDLYGYMDEDAHEYAEFIKEQAFDEVKKLTVSNSDYINNELSKRIQLLQSGRDIGANMNKFSNNLRRVCKDVANSLKEKGEDEMKNTVDGKWNPNYKMHVLAKWECLECEREFILSKKFADGLVDDVNCPYCGSYNVEETVMMDDPDDLSALGCMGISHVEDDKEEGRPATSLMVQAYIYNPGNRDSRLIVSDKDLIQGAGEYDFDKVTLLIKGDTLKEWAEEQNYIDGPEADYEVIDDEY